MDVQLVNNLSMASVNLEELFTFAWDPSNLGSLRDEHACFIALTGYC